MSELFQDISKEAVVDLVRRVEALESKAERASDG